jgi:predicted nucleotidyltransferase
MTTLDEILRTIDENRDRIKRYGVRALGVFGSVVRGEADADRDLDFLVELENETFRAYMGLKSCLEDLFGKKVDLVLSDTIKPSFRDTILSEVRYAEGFQGVP